MAIKKFRFHTRYEKKMVKNRIAIHGFVPLGSKGLQLESHLNLIKEVFPC